MYVFGYLLSRDNYPLSPAVRPHIRKELRTAFVGDDLEENEEQEDEEEDEETEGYSE